MLDLGFKFFTELREKWHFEQSRSFKRMELKDSKMEEEIAVWTGRWLWLVQTHAHVHT